MSKKVFNIKLHSGLQTIFLRNNYVIDVMSSPSELIITVALGLESLAYKWHKVTFSIYLGVH